MRSRVDCSQLALRGNVCAEDSFSTVLAAAARLLGKDVDDALVRALSTNPFAPAIRVTEPCTSWWHIQAQERCLDLVAQALGLSVAAMPDVDHSEDPPFPDSDEARCQHMANYWRQPYVAAINQALEAGSVVVTPREWDPSHHGNGWYGWGIVVEAREDGTILGACLNGRRDNPMVSAAQCRVLSVAVPSLTREEAEWEMLRRAVRRIRGEGTLFAATEEFVFGVDAVDAWIEHMSTVVGFCEECQQRGGRGWTDAKDNGIMLLRDAEFAAAYLRSRHMAFPEIVHAPLDGAMKCYERIAELIRPAVTGEGGESYQQFVGDLAKQNAHADNVLKPIRVELAEAGRYIELALAADRLRAVHFTVTPDVFCGTEYEEAITIEVEELLGSAPYVAAGELFVARGVYELREPVVDSIWLSALGTCTGRMAETVPGKGTFEITASLLWTVPGRERTLDIMIRDTEGEHRGIRMRLELAAKAGVVKREQGRVLIEGVPDRPTGWSWDALLRALQTTLEHRGSVATLNELMAYSGDAFSLCHGSNWQGVAYLCIPTNPVANIAKAYGYEYTCLHSGYGRERFDTLSVSERQVETQQLLDRIWAEIDAGRPTIVGGCTDGCCGEWSVIAGYDRGNMAMSHVGLGEAYRWIGVRGFASNPQFADDQAGGVEGHWNGRFRGTVRPDFVGGWQNNPAFLIGERTDVPSFRDTLLATLSLAVELFRAPGHHIGWWGGVDYHFGEQAYREWARALRRLDYPADLDKPRSAAAYDWYEMGNMDTQVDQVVRGRTAAAEFCDRAAGSLAGAAPFLRQAARHYRDEVEVARSAFAGFIPAHEGDDTRRETWLSSAEVRAQGAVTIESMLVAEQRAVRAIENAIAASEVVPGQTRPETLPELERALAGEHKAESTDE